MNSLLGSLRSVVLIILATSSSLSFATYEDYDASQTEKVYTHHVRRARHRRRYTHRYRAISPIARRAPVHRRHVYRARVAPIAPPKAVILTSKSAGEFAGKSCERRAVGNNSRLCLACNAYFEAGVQDVEGQIRVDRTVMTRVSLGWGQNVCSVIYKKWAYSWTNDGKRHRLPGYGKKLNEAVKAADTALKLGGNGATNYFASYIEKPRWAYKCEASGHYGVHEFFVCPADVESDELAQLHFSADNYVETPREQGHNPLLQNAVLTGDDPAFGAN